MDDRKTSPPIPPCRQSKRAVAPMLAGHLLIATALMIVMPSAMADDVRWLAEVTTAPTVTKLVSLGRVEPLLANESGQMVASLDEWKVLRNVIRETWLTFLGPMPEPRPGIKLEVLSSSLALFTGHPASVAR